MKERGLCFTKLSFFVPTLEGALSARNAESAAPKETDLSLASLKSVHLYKGNDVRGFRQSKENFIKPEMKGLLLRERWREKKRVSARV